MSIIEILIMVAQFIVAISILVGVHEGGHMFFAKLFGMRVEKFFIGFPPKVVGTTIGETEYAIGAIPLGGFVKITGMVDESLDTKNLETEPEPYEFRAKPAWQRLLVMLGGIIFNVILGIIIFTAIVYTQGERFLPASEAKYGVVPGPMAQAMGLQEGDVIVNVSGTPLQKFADVVSPDVLLGSNNYYTVQRQGQQLRIDIPNDLLDQMASRDFRESFLQPIFPFEVEKVIAGMPAAKAGIEPGDKILAVNEVPTPFFHLLQAQLNEHKGDTVTLAVQRQQQQLALSTTVSDDGKLGFQAKNLLRDSTLHYSFLASIPRGADMAWNIVYLNIRGFGKIFKGETKAENSVQGPIGMMRNMYGGSFDLVNFWTITALISMALAFFNLLPIPALDGGHVVFLLYELVSGRKPGLRFMEYAQRIGMALLLLLMVLVVFNDVVKNLF